MISDRRRQRIHDVLARRQPDLSLVLNNIHDPHNVSAILRSCDAFGVLGVHLYYTDTAFPALGRKSSASARKWVEVTRHDSTFSLAQSMRQNGLTLVSTGFSEKSVPLSDWDFIKPTAVMLGNEHRGLDEELSSLCQAELTIPMMGMVQSLNVSVAAAVILHEALRQRQLAGMYDASRIEPQRFEQLRESWESRAERGDD